MPVGGFIIFLSQNADRSSGCGVTGNACTARPSVSPARTVFSFLSQLHRCIAPSRKCVWLLLAISQIRDGVCRRRSRFLVVWVAKQMMRAERHRS